MFGISKEQIIDADFIETDELASIGRAGSPIHNALPILSVTAATKIIVLSSGDITNPIIEENDIVVITGGGAAGVYHVKSSPLTQTSFEVKETIATATSGSLSIYRQAGAKITGFDNSTNGFTAQNVQDAIEEAKASSGTSSDFIERSFSKGGGCSVGSYLRVGEVPTNSTGSPVLPACNITYIQVTASSTVSSTTRMQLTRRTGLTTFVNITGAYVDLPAGQYKAKREGLTIAAGPDWEIGCYNASGSTVQNGIVLFRAVP